MNPTTTSPESFITSEMTAAVGSELGRSVSYPVSRSDIRRWALAIYFPEEPPRMFWDEDDAAATVHGGIVAPEEFNPFAWMSAEPVGRPSGNAPGTTSTEAKLGLAEIATEFMLNGGAETEYGVRMRPGDVITSTTVLAGYEERKGRHGLMLFTRTRTRWENQDGQMVKITTGLLIRY